MAKIKDINGDGKRNFKDTWLGEKLLGGGKTKGPNLKESMAGARRESSAAPMKAAAPKAKPTAAAKPVATKASSPKPAATPVKSVPSVAGTATSRSGVSVSAAAKAPTTKTKNPDLKITGSATGGAGATTTQKKSDKTGKRESLVPTFTKPQGDAAKKILNDRWDAALKTDKAGMNFTEWKRQFAGKQFLLGQAMKEYGDYVERTKKVGMAKGGMVSKKGKC